MLGLHLQACVRDGVAVRVVRRVAERAVDPRLELVGEHVLEPVGLRMDGLDRDPERLRQIQLEEPVMADDLERDSLSRRSEIDAAVGTCSARPSAASFFTIALDRCGRDVQRLARRVVVTFPPSVRSL